MLLFFRACLCADALPAAAASVLHRFVRVSLQLEGMLSPFGELKDCVVIVEKMSQKSKVRPLCVQGTDSMCWQGSYSWQHSTNAAVTPGEAASCCGMLCMPAAEGFQRMCGAAARACHAGPASSVAAAAEWSVFPWCCPAGLRLL